MISFSISLGDIFLPPEIMILSVRPLIISLLSLVNSPRSFVVKNVEVKGSWLRFLFEKYPLAVHLLAILIIFWVIFNLNEGRIVEKGTHQELIKQNGHYKKLSDLQSFA